ncbi:MAG: hypothetical protein ACRD4H_07875, partial [Candidatus Acidiferrales bacterium]
MMALFIMQTRDLRLPVLRATWSIKAALRLPPWVTRPALNATATFPLGVALLISFARFSRL